MRFLPYFIWVAGLIIFNVGFMIGPGVPSKDPTPEVRLHETQQLHLARQFFTVGFLLFVGGVAWTNIAWLVRRNVRRSTTASPST